MVFLDDIGRVVAALRTVRVVPIAEDMADDVTIGSRRCWRAGRGRMASLHGLLAQSGWVTMSDRWTRDTYLCLCRQMEKISRSVGGAATRASGDGDSQAIQKIGTENCLGRGAGVGDARIGQHHPSYLEANVRPHRQAQARHLRWR
jgi:hypothetical protein